jgi:ribonuclease P/MRP protein subunit RPP1
MYEAVHARPDGDSTVARLAMTASEFGFEGVVVRNHGDSPAGYDPAGIAERYGVDVATGVEVRASDPSRASGFVGNHRSRREVVVVHGGEPAINRFAVEQPAVDVLAHPTAGDGEVNHVLAKEAKRNGVRLELSLRPVLTGGECDRVAAIRDLRALATLVDEYEAPFVVSADPRSHLDLRSPRELAALGQTVGLGEDRVREGLREWGRLAARNRERRSEEFVKPGVRLGRPEDAAAGEAPAGNSESEGEGAEGDRTDGEGAERDGTDGEGAQRDEKRDAGD